MRVGIFARTADPSAGGEFTIEREILESIARVSAGGAHSFVFFGTRPEEVPPPSWGEAVALTRPLVEEPFGKLGRVARRVVKALRAPAPSLPLWREDVSWIWEGVRKSGVDAVVSLTPCFLPTVDVPFVTVIWDLEHRRIPMFPEIAGTDEWEKRERGYQVVLGRASRVVVGTEVGKRQAVSYYGVAEEKIRVVPHPTPSFALDAARTGSVSQPDPAEPPFIFYPAQFWPHKNHVCIVRALAVLAGRGILVRAKLSGADRGSQVHVRAEASRLGIAGQVEVVGFLGRPEVVSAYRGATAMVYPSFGGPENLPPLEAFALGCPVIAAEVPGAREQLGDAAFYFDPADPESLAARIEGLLAAPAEAKRLVDKGRSRAIRWTGDDFARSLIGIVDELGPFVGSWRPVSGAASSGKEPS